MSKVFFLWISGIFVGAALYELGKRANTKWEFAHMFEGLVETEARDYLTSTVSKDEKILVSDFQP